MASGYFNHIKRYLQLILGNADDEKLSRYIRAKRSLRKKRSTFRITRSVMFVVIGVMSASFGLKGFLMPNHFIDGGVTGISLLISAKTNIPLAPLIIVLNIPFILLGWRQISKMFSMGSILAITLLAIAVVILPYPVVTEDKLLVSVFGGFFLGAGIGFTIRGGAVIDGTEILAISMSRTRSLTVGDFILIFNIVIFAVAAWLLSVETALYAILTYLAASKTVDFLLEGVEEFTGVTIISHRNEEIGRFIREKMGRGSTVYQGKRGFGKRGESHGSDILFTVVTRLEITRLTNEIDKIDPNAFVVMHSVRDTRGGMVKKKMGAH